MELAVRRPMVTAAALATAGSLALTPVIATPPQLHALDLSPATISTQAVQLTDAWSDLLSNTVSSVVQLGGLFIGLNSTFPLPNPVFIAPVAAQLVLNPLIYAGQLLTGQGAKIPGEIADHLQNLAVLAQAIVSDVIPAIGLQIRTPFIAFQDTISYIANASNKLVALLQAPALFLDAVLNSQYGLIGPNGPIGVPIIIRNLVASGIAAATFPPIVLPFKKASGAKTVAPKAATVTAPSGTASSARSKPKAPSSSNRKATSAKASSKGGGAHSARG
ncbi:hypothetical protein FHT44_002583 [Mycolicibacterium sp. BK634]|uniref:hypothetical protein n=1 Tax=Mycolicibacterium sp. BK634 TaxID=2587099 RepID=UPI0016128719|nr:hypothetical protein [Mycolicibacterium sp. BK634]MBB3750122.1 hypothetical protein [Mycolicibacterium sp. BK634]